MSVTQFKPTELIANQPASFEKFWKLYPQPRRVKKPLAHAKWNAITSETGLDTRTLDRDSGAFVDIHLQATPEDIIAGLERDREIWREPGGFGWRDGGKFIPEACTYLNQGRYE